jgi:hypothetical protein
MRDHFASNLRNLMHIYFFFECLVTLSITISKCISYCKPCDEYYVDETAYQHADCVGSSEDDSSENE